MSERTRPPYRADHVGSLLRPPELLEAREAHAAGRLDDEEPRAGRGRGDPRRRPHAGGGRAADGHRRRVPPRLLAHGLHLLARRHLQGARQPVGAVPQRRGRHRVHARPRCTSTASSASCETIFGDDFDVPAVEVAGEGQTPKLTIPSPSMVHYRGGARRRRRVGLPRHGRVLGRPHLRLRRGGPAARRAGLHVPAVRRHEPRLPQRPEAARDDRRAGLGRRAPARALHPPHQRGARRQRPEGMAVTTHMCRGNFRSSWVAEGGYDFVAEALFGQLDVDGFFMEWDDARSGGFEPLRFVPEGQAGRARARDHQARRARVQGRPQAADRGGVAVRRRSTSSACRPSAGSPRRWRATR